MVRRFITAVAAVILGIAAAKRLIFNGTTGMEMFLGLGIVVVLVGYGVYELCEVKIKSSAFYRTHASSIEQKSRLADDLFLLVGSIGLVIVFLIYDPTTVWLKIGRIFILTVSIVGALAMCWRLFLHLRGHEVPGDRSRHT